LFTIKKYVVFCCRERPILSEEQMELIERLFFELDFYFNVKSGGPGVLVDKNNNPIPLEVDGRMEHLYDSINQISHWILYFSDYNRSSSDRYLYIEFDIYHQRPYGQFAIDAIAISENANGKNEALTVTRDHIILHWPATLLSCLKFKKRTFLKKKFENVGASKSYVSRYSKIVNIPIVLDDSFKNQNGSINRFYNFTFCCDLSPSHSPENAADPNYNKWQVWKYQKRRMCCKTIYAVPNHKSLRNRGHTSELTTGEFVFLFDLSSEWKNSDIQRLQFPGLVPKSIVTFNSIGVENFALDVDKHKIFVTKRNGLVESEYEYEGSIFDAMRKKALSYALSNEDFKNKVKTHIGWNKSNADFNDYLLESIIRPWELVQKSQLEEHISLWNILVPLFSGANYRFTLNEQTYFLKDDNMVFSWTSVEMHKSAEEIISWDGSIAQKIKITGNFSWVNKN